MSLMAHVRSMKHLQMEQLHQLQKRTEGTAEHTEIGDIFQVLEKSESDNDKESSNPDEGPKATDKPEDASMQESDQGECKVKATSLLQIFHLVYFCFGSEILGPLVK